MGIGIIMVTDGAAGADGPPMFATIIGAAAPADANPAVPAETAPAFAMRGAPPAGAGAEGLPVPAAPMFDAARDPPALDGAEGLPVPEALTATGA